MRVLPTLLAALGCLLLSMTTTQARAQRSPAGFAETFALADDRSATLDQLIPGTEDYYYYTCLDLEHSGRLAEIPAVLSTWKERHGTTARHQQIRLRHMLLSYGEKPAETLAQLRGELGLRFDDARQARGEAPDLPSRLDPALISRQALNQRAINQSSNLSGFTDRALESLARAPLNAEQLRHLLERIDRPDIPNLPELVARDLKNPRSGGFGSLNAHSLLLREQLDAVARLVPEALNDGDFVQEYLQRLVPGADVPWRSDPSARGAYLEELERFANRLTGAHNSLKAHVLYHRLAHDLAVGAVGSEANRNRFLRYLQLPRRDELRNPEFLRRSGRATMVDGNQAFATGFDRIGGDASLIDRYLARLLVDADSAEAYADYLHPDHVKRVFAETKILAGIGDMERWYSVLGDPQRYESLKQRVDIDFAPEQPTSYAVDDRVELAVDVKNVPMLLVKVFEINAFEVYRATGQEVQPGIDLDGLVANSETTIEYDSPAIRRVRRTIPVPGITGPGVYVVELIGNGTSSRAIVRKGHLRATSRISAAGHKVVVRDADGTPLPDATVWFGGREFEANERAEVTIPFSTQPGTRPMVLRHRGLATLMPLAHRAESYDLQAGIHIARESLVADGTAKIVVRPRVTLNDHTIASAVLESPRLSIRTTDLSGISANLDIRDLALDDNGEIVHEVPVPDRLASLTVQLHGEIQPMTGDEPVRLSSAQADFAINTIDGSMLTGSPLLARATDGYTLDLLGKNGEPIGERSLSVTLRHRDYTTPVTTQLMTDASGRVVLGTLEGIEWLQVTDTLASHSSGWRLDAHGAAPQDVRNAAAGQEVRIPYDGQATVADRSVLSVLEVRNGKFVADAIRHARMELGFVVLSGLAPGDYDIRIEETGARVHLAVIPGAAHAGWVVGTTRSGELRGNEPMQITAAAIQGNQLTIDVANSSAATRVHVYASRYVPAFDAHRNLDVGRNPAPGIEPAAAAASSYHSGRRISDEYRYILERRFAKRFPGNMLERPSLLLNPWAPDDIEFLSDSWNSALGLGGGAGGRYAGRGGRKRSGGRPSPKPEGSTYSEDPSAFANLDWLRGTSEFVANLRPDQNGRVTVPLAQLGDGSSVQIYAVDSGETAFRQVFRTEAPIARRDRRMRTTMPEGSHYSEQRRIDYLGAGDKIEVTAGATDVATYDTLAKAHQLLVALSDDATLTEFDFVLRWPNLEVEEKHRLFTKYTCAELNFFVHEKDPEFFAAVVRPYLSQKYHKTFMDHWLLDEDLAGYLEPWAFGQLNALERILLARRITDRADSIRRYGDELLELRDDDPAAMDVLFQTALGQTRFSVGAIEESLKSLESKQARAELGAMDAPAAAAAPEPSERAGRRGRSMDRDKGEDGVVAEEDEEVEAAPSGNDDFFMGTGRRLAEDLDERRNQRAFFRQPRDTQLLVDQHYWNLTLGNQLPELIPINHFWADFAAHEDGAFVSPNLAEAKGSFAEMLMALAVLDLPFEAGEHAMEPDEGRLTITAGSPMLVIRKDLTPAEAADEAQPILVSQNLFRQDARFRFVGNQRLDAFVTGEFVKGIAYGCQVIVTNPTSSPRRLELLLQIPEGALPLAGAARTKGHAVALQPYATQSVEYGFYFPAAGDMRHYPVHISEAGGLIAYADERDLQVVDQATTIDTESWAHVSQEGSSAEVLGYLRTANLARTDLERIAWRMGERAFFESVLDLLRERHVYSGRLWSYGLVHGDQPSMREYLPHATSLTSRLGIAFASPLLELDPEVRKTHQHIEFSPWINQRAHPFDDAWQITNGAVRNQYQRLMDALCQRASLDADDWLAVTYYMLLADRIEDGLRAFDKIDADSIAARVQYDYLRAYVSFYREDHAVARRVAERYLDHPVERWQRRFGEVIAQLDEVATGAGAVTSAPDPQDQDALALTEPSLELDVEARQVAIAHRNVEACEVAYYEMDVEFLFSAQPFVQDGSRSFAFVRPHLEETRALDGASGELVFDLPERFRNSNVLVEVRAGGITRRQPYFANTLTVHTLDTYGQIQVAHADSGRPLSKVYVKVFARKADGSIAFYKDGYTDLRGRFDYASVTVSGGISAEKLAVLVMSDELGATIRELTPPTQ